MKNKKLKVLFGLVLTLALILTFTATALASAGDVPQPVKGRTDNGDGTYTLSMSVTGDSERRVTKVNVVVVLDTSGSMNDPAGGGSSRMDAAKTAVNLLANTLLGYNGGQNPNDTVQMALVSFATTATSRTPVTSYSTFSGQVNGLNPNGGTNWEAALYAANNVSFGDNDRTFVIFVSDGNPTFRTSPNGYYRDFYQNGVYGNGQEDTQNVNRCYNAATDDARAIVNAGKEFYTIGAYGNVDRMQSLTTAAGAPANHYYSAANTAALNSAIASILAEIELAGIGDVTMTDNTPKHIDSTSTQVTDLISVDSKSFKYYRAGGSYSSEGYGDEWLPTDDPAPPAARVVDGNVVWEFPENFILEDGVKYTVTFICSPSQYIYDLKAELDNGGDYDEVVPEDIQEYFDENGGLKTNTGASLSYTDTRTNQSGTVNFNVDGTVPTESKDIEVEKKWVGNYQQEELEPVDMVVNCGTEKFGEIHLTKEDDYKGDIHIAPGVMTVKGTTVNVLAEGHDYILVEPKNLSYHWELVADVMHPMILNGEMTMLVKVVDEEEKAAISGVDATTTDAEGKYYYINGEYYKVSDEVNGLTATNYRRSILQLTKVVDGDDAPADAVFPFTLNVVNSLAPDSEPADDPDHESDYWVWISVRDKDKNPITTGVTGATGQGKDDDGDPNGWYYLPSGKDITIPAKAGYSIRVNYLPTGSTYTITEGDMPSAAFTFVKSELSAVEGEAVDTTFTPGTTTKGTIESANSTYQVTFTNEYSLVDINVEKVWDDDNDALGLRPQELELTLSGAPQGTTVPEPEISKSEDGNTWTYTWAGLPRYTGNGDDKTEIEYTVTEDEVPDGYTCEETEAEDGGTITNTIETGTLTVTKTFSGDATENEISDDFAITVAGQGDGAETYILKLAAPDPAVEGTFGPADGSSFANGYTWTFPVPANTYVISESSQNVEGYDCVTKYDNTEAESKSVTVEDDATPTVTITNTYEEEASGGTLTIVKIVDGANMPSSTKFTITGLEDFKKEISIGDFEKNDKGEYVYTYPAAADEDAESGDDEPLAAGKYTVTEDRGSAKVDGYTLHILGENNVTKTLEDGGEIKFTIRNRYSDPSEQYVPEELNGEDHYAYMIGYPDGLVHPERNITRAEVATIFFRLLTDEAREANLSTVNSFGDVEDGMWFNVSVSTMANMGIVNGYPDGDFHPNDNITRAEFAAIAARFDKEAKDSANIFTDIDGHWAKSYILRAVNRGWINGYPDSTFRPDRLATRAEVAAMVNRVLVRDPEDPEDLLPDMIKWPDNMDTRAWYYLDIQEATNTHEYERQTKPTEVWMQLLENPDWTKYQY